MGRYERNKGIRAERQVVAILRELGLDARRVPLSGAAPHFKGDVQIYTKAGKLLAEVKVRRNGFTSLYRWLDESAGEILIIKQDRRPFLTVMPLDVLARILK